MPTDEFVCEVRYVLDPARVAEFEEYAHVWIELTERHGGSHKGFFVTRDSLPSNPLSHPTRGSEVTGDLGVALFSFPDEEGYRRYRREVAIDPDAILANAHYRHNPPFISYERLFLRTVARGVQ